MVGISSSPSTNITDGDNVAEAGKAKIRDIEISLTETYTMIKTLEVTNIRQELVDFYTYKLYLHSFILIGKMNNSYY